MTEAGERRPHRGGAGGQRRVRCGAVIRCEPGAGQVAVTKAPQFTRLPFGQLPVIIPDRLAKVRERSCHVRPGVHDPVKMWTVRLAAGEDGLARRRQALGLLPPVRVGGNPGHFDSLILRKVLERGARIHVSFRFPWIVQDMLAGRDKALVLLKHPDQGRPCLGRDIRVLRKRPDARDHVHVALGVEWMGCRLAGRLR